MRCLHHDIERGRCRQRQQDAQKAEQLSSRQHRENNGDWMQADTVADQRGRQDHALQRLPDAKNQQDQDGMQHVLELEHGGNQGRHQANECTQVRHDTEQSGG